MKLLLLGFVVGAIVAPATVQADAQPFKLTLAPAIAIVAADQHQASFLLVNSSSAPVHIDVTTTDAWVIPGERSFDIPARQRHTMPAVITRHLDFDAGGDHETDVAFSIPPTQDGTIRVSFAIAARVIIDTGGRALHNLRILGLSAPAVADSWDSPDVNLTLDNSASNVHALVNIEPFGQVLVLRNQTRVLSLPWTHHPWIGFGSISVDGRTVHTLFLPWRLALGLIALFAGLWLVRQVRRSP